jgi:hypothetical protein
MMQKQQSPLIRGKDLTQMWGRGLFFSESDPRGHRRIFTQESFDVACKKALAWGISFVHIQVADGPNIWYSMEELQGLAEVAKANGLRCYPTHFCYGDGAGSSVTLEARISALLGQIFGGVCPTMEKEWDTPKAKMWATEYGKQMRVAWRGPVLPMLYANPSQHLQFPYLELLACSSGWMPMIYGDIPSAYRILSSLESQWMALSRAFASQYGYVAPVQPILEVSGLESVDLHAFLTQVQTYGYCGFWCDKTYAPYVDTILSAPEPSWEISAPAPTMKPQPAQPIQISGPIPMIALGMEQGLSDEDLAACYSDDENLTPDLTSPLVTLWAKLTQKGYGIGKVTGPVEDITRQGKAFKVLPCVGGDIWYNDREKRTWVQHHTHARTPGALPSPAKEPEPVSGEEVPVAQDAG